MVDAAGLSSYVELHLHTCYSLLEGASTPRELITRAAEQGHDTLAITDRNNLYGAMVFARSCQEANIRPLIGVELTVASGSGAPDDGGRDDPDDPRCRYDLTLLAANRQGYANLCRLVSQAHGWGLADQADRERRRRDPCVALDRVRQHTAGVVCLTGGRNGQLARQVAAGDRPGAEATLRRLVDWFGRGNVWVELHDNLVEGDRPRNQALVSVARKLGVGVVATGCVHYHERRRHRLHDALCAIRHRATLETTHQQRRPNSEFYLRSPEEQAARFAEWPDAVANTRRVAELCSFDLNQDLGYRLPTPAVSAGHTPDTWLEQLCRQAIAQRYPPHQRAAAHQRLDEEMQLIRHHGLAGFFLVYHEVLELAVEVAAEVRRDAPRGKIGMAPGRGRGSSVGSIVCYLIGLSHIDPVANNLFLGRFLNDAMTSLPDIDLDFPRDIRDRLFQRVYEHWGIDRAALVAIFPRYRIRSAIRDLGKVLGLPSASIDHLAKVTEGHRSAGDVEAEMERVADLRSLTTGSGWMHLIELARELADFPRHVSQHVGGMVIASDPLIDCVPIQPAAWPGRYICQWDKDDIDDARMVKIDFLALGMLSLVEECLDLCAQRHTDEQPIDLSRIDFADPRVFTRIGRGDTIGVFQIESRAQAGILPRTRPRNLDDLTAQVAIIRPGPIVGGAVHRYIEGRKDRDRGGVAATVPHPCVEEALGETHGVVLFQEQVVQVAMAMGGFTAGEAETFRRAMGRKDWDATRQEEYRGKFLAGAAARDVPEDVAEDVFQSLVGFAQFGFPKSHAAAFGLLAYQTAWLKEYHPAEFFCALFNNWPMGFYPPHVFTNDARRHGIRIVRPDIGESLATCTVADTSKTASGGAYPRLDADTRPQNDLGEVPREGQRGAVRIGLGYIRGMGATTAAAIVQEREQSGPFRSLRDFAQRTALAGEAIENAIRVGAFDGLGLQRRELLWQLWLLGLGKGTPPPARDNGRPRYRQLRLDLPTEQDHVSLPDLSSYQAMADDYEVLGLSPEAHPMQFLRKELGPEIRSTADLRSVPPGSTAHTAGLVVCRQRPGTAAGAVYLLLEDEMGLVNIVVSPRHYDRCRTEVRTSAFLRISGVVDHLAGDVATVRARTIEPIKPGAGALRTPDGKNWG
jgi:error-prone DNA polymerase